MSENTGWTCCAGKGGCGDGPGATERRPGEMDRRDFMKTTAATAGVLGLAGHASGREALTAEEQAAVAAWTSSLLDRGERVQYRGASLDKIAMPLGGIGCGQLYLGGRGDLVSWQIVNNFNTAANVAGPNFAVWAQADGAAAQAKLLVEGERDGRAGFSEAIFSGEYPLAWIDFSDASVAWPLRVQMEAYSPFIPLNAKDSGLPCVVFRYELENISAEVVNASVLGLLPNLAGWDGYGSLTRPEHPDFCGHLNSIQRDGETLRVDLGAQGGARHRFDAPLTIATNDRTIAQRMRLLGKARVEHAGNLPAGTGERVVYWAGDTPAGGVGEDLLAALRRVEEGAGIVIAGMEMGALAVCASGGQRRRAKTFEDWEGGDYDGWELEGNCFGPKPVDAQLPGQQPVSGQRGKAYFNSFFGGDDTTGTAKSRTFRLRHDYVHVLVGGGAFPGETCIQLLVEGKVVHQAAGDNTEQIKPVAWSVAEHRGKNAHFRILDTRKGGWGHVLVDEIVFSNSPASPFGASKAPLELKAALPVTWRRIARAENGAAAAPEGLHGSLAGVPVSAKAYWRLSGAQLAEGAEVLLQTDDGAPLVVAGRHGQGRVVLCLGDPADWAPWLGHEGDRKLIAALIAHAAGVKYLPARPGNEAGLAAEDRISALPHAGTMSLAVRGGEAAACAQWSDLGAVWARFAQDGGLPGSAEGASAPGQAWNAALAARVALGPGEKRTVEFTAAWHFPNRTRTAHYGWGPGAFQYDYRLGNHYNNHFADAGAVAAYAAREAERLRTQTHAFHAAFYSTTAPRYFLDAITANIAILRSPIYVWLEDGTVGGFEGTDACCPMNCTHVYNYAMAMPYLFPELERNVRELDLLINRDPVRNFVPHRTALPLSVPRLGDEIGGPHHHALDGELGALLKLYREWRVCGDRAWLRTMWPAAKGVMQHVLDEHDTVKDGVLRGEQPNTYDTHLFGSNMFIGGLYLGALRAVEEMARIMGDEEFAITCRARYEKGHRGYEGICWNGEYYFNVYNAPDATPETYNNANCYGDGCHADQALGQWWAHHLGLGHLCDPGRARTMLASIHRHNWRPTLRDHVHSQRVFAEGGEKGLLVVTWPRGGRPERPILYCDEVWTGIEYAVACAMLHEGMVTEALQIVRGARDRYTGAQRNPWSEIECGGHYARAMSSYALLHAVAGFDHDAGRQRLAIAPRIHRDDFIVFFTTGTGWGTVSLAREGAKARLKIEAKYGAITLREIQTDVDARHARVLGGARLPVRDGCVDLGEAVTIAPGKPLAVALG